MKKAILVGFALSAALLVAVVTSGASSAQVNDGPYSDNSVVSQPAGQEQSSQGT